MRKNDSCCLTRAHLGRKETTAVGGLAQLTSVPSVLITVMLCALVGCNVAGSRNDDSSTDQGKRLLGFWNLVLPAGRTFTSPLLQLRFFKNGGAGIQGVEDVGDNNISVTEKADKIWKKIISGERFQPTQFAVGGSFKVLDGARIELSVQKEEVLEVLISGDRLTTKNTRGKTFEWEREK